MNAKILCLSGDGVGTEVMEQAVEVLTSIACAFSHRFTFINHKIGGASIEANRQPITDEVIQAALEADGILLGPVGGSKWDMLLGEHRPEAGLVHLAKALNISAAIIPCNITSGQKGISPLRHLSGEGEVDFLIVHPIDHLSLALSQQLSNEGEYTHLYMPQHAWAIEQVARTAFTQAQKRRKMLYNVDQSNLFSTSRLWRETVIKVAFDYPDVALVHLSPQECVAQLIKQPHLFDTLLSEAFWGDIFSHEAGALVGSPSLLYALWSGKDASLYQPIHGPLAELTGKDAANPIGMIRASAAMLRNNLALTQEADCIDLAIDNVLSAGWRSADLALLGDDITPASTITQLISEQIDTIGALMSEHKYF